MSKWVDGFTVGVHVQNLFDNVHREFMGGPKMGRLGQLRLTYDIF